jgi:predicted nucleotidyltransferase
VANDLSRYDVWLGWLTDRAAADPDVLVAWLGGSAVTDGWDDWSDIDIDVLCRPGTSSAAYERWLAALVPELEPASVWDTPRDWRPDGRQCFVCMQPRPGLLDEPTVLVDLVMSDLSDAHRHLDVRRHGSPLVLHDPDGLLVLRDDDPVVQAREMAEAVRQVRQKRPVSEWLVNRALARGHVAEGLDLYVRHGLHLLVRLVRAEHCPERHDYGLRYLRDDLPAEVADRLEALVPGESGRPLRELSAECFAWMDELLA